MLSDVPVAAVCVAKSSNNGLGMDERKLIYAGEYKPRDKSVVIACKLAGVGSTKYRTGTSGIGCRGVAMCLIRLAGDQYCQALRIDVITLQRGHTCAL